MGMSSSQARLLNLTSRMHQIEYKAAKLEAEKLQMANESNRVYDEYLLALEQSKIAVNILSTDGSVTHTDLTADLIYNYGNLGSQYALVTNDDKALVSSELHTTYQNTNSLSAFLTAMGMDETYTQTIHHKEINPDYETALSNYNNDHSTWVVNNDAYQAYQNGIANYTIQHANWVTNTAAYNQYQEDMAKYNTYLAEKATHDQWLVDKANYDNYIQRKAEYEKWLTENPEDVKEDKNQPWWNLLDTGVGREGLDKDFTTAASKYCYGAAKDGNPGCYGHVLAHMLDFDGTNITNQTYTTTLGTITPNVKSNSSGGGCHNVSMVDINGNTTNTNVIFKETSDVANSGVLVNVFGETCDVNNSSSDYEKLLSKFNTNGTAKTLKQWIIDLYYITQHTTETRGIVSGYPLKEDGTPDNKAFGATIENIQSSLAASFYNFNEVTYNQAVEDYNNRGMTEPTPVSDPGTEPTVNFVSEPNFVANPGAEPQMPTFAADPGAEPQLETYVAGIEQFNEWDETVTHSTFSDKALAQWYVNVWCKMEGQNATPIVQELIVHDDATDSNKAIYSVQNINKSITTYGTNPFSNSIENENYIVISDEKLNDNKWISNTVQAGMVMIQVWDKLSGGFVDTSVATSVNLKEVDDKTLIKKAEAKYEADMLKIDRKDRKYDTDLATLEAERNAIKQEIETLKTVTKENVERTFKLFS